jgi:hypothetical protein
MARGQVVRVYLASAVQTSAGPGPGVKVLPFGEAARLVADRRAVFGTEPQGFGGGRAGLRSWRRRHPGLLPWPTVTA